ncbi:hypothetical protein [Aquimarina aggregata]|uniref:hypothetical protein n=1 Tax=Aquimarina aggregata TaxID=1642818 RepID=UPI00249103FE|nr:hypothetical protein [Aquimarina aggregata]
MNVHGLIYMTIMLIFSVSISTYSQKKVTKQHEFKPFKDHSISKKRTKMPIYKPDINLDKQINLGISTTHEKILMPIYSPFSLALTNPKQRLWHKEMTKKFKQSKK